MSDTGVWVLNTGEDPNQSDEVTPQTHSREKVLVHLPTDEVVSSYASLERILTSLGWERYYSGDPVLLQFHKRSSVDLISIPKDFSKFGTVHMNDVVDKNPNTFQVRDA